MIHTRCPECNKVLKADYKQRGRLGRCPFCGTKFTIEAVGWWAALTSGARPVEMAEKEKEKEKKPEGEKSEFEY